MTETIMTPDVLAHLSVDFIAPYVAYLCHERYALSLSLTECGG